MDKDVYASLFEGKDENGEFEELDDDFVTQAMIEPELPDFDFDAHIASLIARSEQALGINKARGWEDEEYEERDAEVKNGVDISARRGADAASNKVDFTDAELEQLLEDYDEDELGSLSGVRFCLLDIPFQICVRFSY
jgi:hypothetical protein